MLRKNVKNISHANTNRTDKRIVLVVSLFNRELTQLLEKKCIAALKIAGIHDSCIDIVYVPGAFEIPLACLKCITKAKKSRKPYHAVIALGVIIKGDTYHFELIASGCARGIMEVMLKTETPIIFEVLAGERQDMEKRTGDDEYNKGIEAAHSALEILTD